MSTESYPERIYVVDAENRPLAVMNAEQIHQQGLRHRGFMLLLTDPKGRLILRRLDKNHPLYPGRWDIAGSGHVGAGEASEEAAERHLPPVAQELGESLRHILTVTGDAGTGDEIVEVLGGSVPDQIAQALARDLTFLIVDQDELDALASSYPDQLSPTLLTVWKTRLHRQGAS